MNESQKEKYTGRASVPERMQPRCLSARLCLWGLCVLTLLYIPVQWKLAHPGSAPIFNAHHRDMARQFSQAQSAMRQQLVAECLHHGVHDIYFDDGDVISPFLINQFAAIPGCALHRETVVTPAPPEAELGCSTVIVDEILPDAWNEGTDSRTLGRLEGQVVSLQAWQSQGGLFGFRLLQVSGCPHTEAALGEAR